MDTSRYDDENNVLAVPHERLPLDDKNADAEAFWTLVDCIRADEHSASVVCPARECIAADGRWITYDGSVFSEEMTGELWTNRLVRDPEDEA